MGGVGSDGDKWARYRNHFYDPVNNRGYRCGECDIEFPGLKAFEWGLESGYDHWGRETFTDIPGQNYSIKDANDYYKRGLTETSKDERDGQ